MCSPSCQCNVQVALWCSRQFNKLYPIQTGTISAQTQFCSSLLIHPLLVGCPFWQNFPCLFIRNCTSVSLKWRPRDLFKYGFSCAICHKLLYPYFTLTYIFSHYCTKFMCYNVMQIAFDLHLWSSLCQMFVRLMYTYICLITKSAHLQCVIAKTGTSFLLWSFSK